MVAVSSLGANHYARYYGAIGPAKAAMENLVRYFGAELGPAGFASTASRRHWSTIPATAGRTSSPGSRRCRRRWQTRPRLRRLGHPDELASVIVSLLSSDFQFVTGLTIPVDGGYTLLA